jgi:hypothetical protein
MQQVLPLERDSFDARDVLPGAHQGGIYFGSIGCAVISYPTMLVNSHNGARCYILPPNNTHPPLSPNVKAFNSSVIDERLLELAGELSEEHVASKFGLAGEEGGAAWKDVGMWSDSEWTLLVGKGLGSMSKNCFWFCDAPSANRPCRCACWSNEGKGLEVSAVCILTLHLRAQARLQVRPTC